MDNPYHTNPTDAQIHSDVLGGYKDYLRDSYIVASRIKMPVEQCFYWLREFNYSLQDLRNYQPYEIVQAVQHHESLDQPTINAVHDDGREEIPF